MSPIVLGEHMALPIFHVERERPGVFGTRSEVAGTCFLLGDGFFITAGHVMRAVKSTTSIGGIGLLRPADYWRLFVCRWHRGRGYRQISRSRGSPTRTSH